MNARGGLGDLGIGLCWGTIRQADLAQFIEGAARHGFATIQICPELYDDWQAQGHSDAALRRRLSDAGVRVVLIDGIGADLPGLPAGPLVFNGQTMARHDASRCLEVADAVGAAVVNLSSYGGEQVALQEMADAVGAICRKAAAGGVGIVLEAVPEASIGSLASALDIVRACGEPNCAVLLDTWHLARSGGSLAEIVALPAGTIGAVQVSDRIEPPAGTPYVPMAGRRLPGEGELPLGAMLAAALANNPALTIEIEVFSEELRRLAVADAFDRVGAAVRAWREALA